MASQRVTLKHVYLLKYIKNPSESQPASLWCRSLFSGICQWAQSPHPLTASSGSCSGTEQQSLLEILR